MTDYADFWHRLLPLYDVREAQAVVRLLLDVGFGLSFTDVCCGKITQLSADKRTRLAEMMERLVAGEPVQYVLGVADFCGRSFAVGRGVLIPRPETEELCEWVESSVKDNSTILDVGTGSGCIAVTLAKDVEGASVTAWDISEEALRIAQSNADRLNARVLFELQNILNAPEESGKWSAIVSNPPYICEKERTAMSRNVLDYEPVEALFVPNDRPLLFYEAVARYAVKALKERGLLFFEINPLYADCLRSLLLTLGYNNVELRKDGYGKLRFLKAEKQASMLSLV